MNVIADLYPLRKTKQIDKLVELSAAFVHKKWHGLDEREFIKRKHLFTKNIAYITYYTEFILKNNRFIEGESIILQFPHGAYKYARDVIKGRWPEAEAIISKTATNSYWYASDVIKGRFELGEEAINRVPTAQRLYNNLLESLESK